MAERFNAALAVVLAHEGGVSDHAQDPGGFTVRGLTLGFLRAFGLDINNDGVIDRRDLLDLTDVDIAHIYRTKIWVPAKCEGLPLGLDLAVFDAAVNLGHPRALKLLQKALGVKADGLIGTISWRAIKNARPERLLTEFTARRGFYYATRLKVIYFGLGWYRRLVDVYRRALADMNQGERT